MTIQVAGQTIQLLPERAFFWTEERILGLSDVHFGKAQSLQRAGIPISAEAHETDLVRIQSLIERYEPERVVVLGDFIHAKDSWSLEVTSQLIRFFEANRSTYWTLIIGNHERGSLEFLKRLPIELSAEDLKISSLTLAHSHSENTDANSFRIEGHVHPACELREGSVKLRLPCFVEEPKRLLIPSFGELTGGFIMEKTKNNKIFAVTGQQVFEVKGKH